MKLIAAGTGGVKEDFLFNCTRNPACQRQYFMPIPGITSVMQFYADLPGALGSVSIEIMDCNDNPTGAVAGSSITGQKPDGTYYAVFGDITPSGPLPSAFYFKFDIDGNIFFTNHFKVEPCEPLTLLQGCYPNENWPADATDCNGIYYGFPEGDTSYRYFHWAYVRNLSVIQQKTSFKFTVFNSQKVYKNTTNKSYLLEAEPLLVPEYFATIIAGIYARGNIRIGGAEWRLAEEAEISVTDTDSKLWRIDVELAEECKQSFGCGPADCALPEPTEDECCSPTDVVASVGEGEVAACCSPDIESVEVFEGTPPCCDPEDVTATLEPLGEFLIIHELETEAGGDQTFNFFVPSGASGWVDWGDGRIEAFSTAGPTLALSHNFPAGIWRQTFYFDIDTQIPSFDNDGLGIGNCSFFSHSDNFTQLTGIGLFKVLDINDVLPPAASQIVLAAYQGSPVSIQSSMDFSALVATVNTLNITAFPLLDTITNIPSTVTNIFDISNNPELVDVDSGGSIPAALQQTMNNNKDGLAYGTLDLSICNNATFKQDFSSGQVDAILIALDANGLNNGFCDVRQIPTAAPGGSGATAKANLIGKGWTVLTD